MICNMLLRYRFWAAIERRRGQGFKRSPHRDRWCMTLAQASMDFISRCQSSRNKEHKSSPNLGCPKLTRIQNYRVGVIATFIKNGHESFEMRSKPGGRQTRYVLNQCGVGPDIDDRSRNSWQYSIAWIMMLARTRDGEALTWRARNNQQLAGGPDGLVAN